MTSLADVNYYRVYILPVPFFAALLLCRPCHLVFNLHFSLSLHVSGGSILLLHYTPWL